MAKIKQFFNNILAVICNFFAMIGKYIKEGFSWLGNTIVMQAIGDVLMYLPRKLNDRLRNDQRKSMWGIIFVIPLLIGFIYFFFIPFILTFKYSFSYVDKFTGHAGLTSIWVGFSNYQYIFKELSISLACSLSQSHSRQENLIKKSVGNEESDKISFSLGI